MCIRDRLNIPSELLGALVCGLLIRVPMKIGKLDVNPLVNTFVSTCVSGFTFAALSAYINVVSVGGDFAVAMAAYVAIVQMCIRDRVIRGLKPGAHLGLYDARREEEIFARVDSYNEGPLYNENLREIYACLLYTSRCV